MSYINTFGVTDGLSGDMLASSLANLVHLSNILKAILNNNCQSQKWVLQNIPNVCLLHERWLVVCVGLEFAQSSLPMSFS